MVSAQERLTRTFTRSSHTYTRTERTEISKTRGGETKREVRVEESTQVGGGGSPFRDVFGDFLGRESLSSFAGITARPEGEDLNLKAALGMWNRVRETGVSASRSGVRPSDHDGSGHQPQWEDRGRGHRGWGEQHLQRALHPSGNGTPHRQCQVQGPARPRQPLPVYRGAYG